MNRWRQRRVSENIQTPRRTVATWQLVLDRECEIALAKPSLTPNEVTEIESVFNMVDQSIRVTVEGGLGNQLFQLAAAMSLADYTGGQAELVRTPSRPGNTPRPFHLDFAVALGAAICSEFPSTNAVWHEPSWGYNPEFWDLLPGVHLVGTFQSWQYCVNTRDRILAALQGDQEFNRGQRLGETMEGFIACHLRRGDYLKQPFRNHHGLTRLHWHRYCIGKLRNRLGLDTTVIFSESKKAAWTLRAITPGKTLIAPRESALFTLGLMTQASGWNISNSSFSWWAAFLGCGEKGPVLSPTPWFLSRNTSLESLIPVGWELEGNALKGGTRRKLERLVRKHWLRCK